MSGKVWINNNKNHVNLLGWCSWHFWSEKTSNNSTAEQLSRTIDYILLLLVYRVPIYPIQNDFSATYHTNCIECHHSITIEFCIVYRFVPCTIVNSSLTNCIWIVIITLTFILKGQSNKKEQKNKPDSFCIKQAVIINFKNPFLGMKFKLFKKDQLQHSHNF